MSADALVSRLKKCKHTRQGSWVACCPAHPDRSPSLTVRELPDGFVLVHCFAGCSIEEICAAVGIELDELFPEKLERHHNPPLRQRFNAQDVLECLSEEAAIVAVAASNVRNGKTLVQSDHDRLMQAYQRLERGRELSNGER